MEATALFVSKRTPSAMSKFRASICGALNRNSPGGPKPFSLVATVRRRVEPATFFSKPAFFQIPQTYLGGDYKFLT